VYVGQYKTGRGCERKKTLAIAWQCLLISGKIFRRITTPRQISETIHTPESRGSRVLHRPYYDDLKVWIRPLINQVLTKFLGDKIRLVTNYDSQKPL